MKNNYAKRAFKRSGLTQEIKGRTIVFKEKYGPAYYLAETPKMALKVFLHVLRERFEGGWYWEPDPPDPLDFDPKEIPNFPPSFQREMERKATDYKDKLAFYEDCLEEYKNISDISKFGKALLAYEILSDRIDWEYESWEIINPTIL